MAGGLLKKVAGGVQIMSYADYAYMGWLLRHYYAGDETIGSLRINSAPSGWVSIGSVIDRSKSVGKLSVTEDIWGQPVTVPDIANESAVTYTIYQNRNIVPYPTPTTAGPIWYDNDNNTMYPHNHPNYESTIVPFLDQNLQLMATGLLDGTYLLATASPGSTWASTGYSMQNRVVVAGNTSGPQTTTYTLYRRINEPNIYPVIRPLKGTASGLQEMTNTEILEFYYPYMLYSISQRGRLRYSFTSSPSGTYGTSGSFTETYYSSTGSQYADSAVSYATYSRNATDLQTKTYSLVRYY